MPPAKDAIPITGEEEDVADREDNDAEAVEAEVIENSGKDPVLFCRDTMAPPDVCI